MAAGDGRAGKLADHVAGAGLVLGVAGREMAGNGVGGHPVAARFDGGAQCRFVEAGLRRAVGIVPAGDEDHRVLAERAGQIGAFERRFVKADHDEAGAPADTLDDGVRRQRRRQRDKPDIARGAVETLENTGNRATDADRQVLARRQRLAGAENGACGAVEKRRVGEGAAGIKSDNQCHDAMSRG